MKVENAVKVEPVGEFELKGIRRPLPAYNVVGVGSSARELYLAERVGSQLKAEQCQNSDLIHL